MDCKTARMLLEFSRPQAGEMDAAEVAALERHLAGCPDCEEHARAERRIDDHLAKAMCQVDVPDRLRPLLLTRLAQERAPWYRHHLRLLVGVAASLAAMLLVGWGIHLWQASQRTVLNPDEFADFIPEGNPPLRESIEEDFRRQGHVVSIPSDLNFDLLTTWGIEKFQGRDVPCLLFQRPGDVDPHGQRDIARVYLLSSKQFDLRSLDPKLPHVHGRRFNVLIQKERDRQAAIIFYTGDNLNWLISPVQAL